jgi:hypothetical protein
MKSQRARRSLGACSRVGLLSLLVAAVDARAAAYDLVVIAAVAQAEGFVIARSLSINENGQLGFLVQRADPNPLEPGFWDAYRGEESVVTPIAIDIDFFSEAGAAPAARVDDAGSVAFVGSLPPAGPSGVLAGSGGAVGALVPVSASASNVMLLDRSGTGQVAFLSNSSRGLAVQRRESNGGLTVFADQFDLVYSAFGGFEIAINSAGTVASYVDQVDGKSGIGRSTPLDGYETIVLESPGFFPQPFIIDMDDTGTVVFLAFPTKDGGGGGLYTTNGGAPALWVDDSGPFSRFPGAALSHSGARRVFQAALDGDVSSDGGIYVGTDPATDAVVAVGDSLAGSSVSLLALGDVNDAGQIALYAKLVDGRDLVVRADPVPEPDAVLACASALAALAIRARRRH